MPPQLNGRQQGKNNSADEHAGDRAPAATEDQVGECDNRQIFDVEREGERYTRKDRPAVKPMKCQGEH